HGRHAAQPLRDRKRKHCRHKRAGDGRQGISRRLDDRRRASPRRPPTIGKRTRNGETVSTSLCAEPPEIPFGAESGLAPKHRLVRKEPVRSCSPEHTVTWTVSTR